MSESLTRKGKDLFQENGFLTEEGKAFLLPLHRELVRIMVSYEVQTMTQQELQMLQANVSKLAADLFSEAQIDKNYRGSR